MSEIIASPSAAPVSDQFLTMLEILIDPASAARRIHRSAPWIVPVLTAALATALIGYLLMPLTLQIMAMNPPSNIPREQYAQALPVIEKGMRFTLLAAPVMLAAKLLILAGLLKLMVLLAGLEIIFKKLFALLANAGTVPLLESLASFAVIQARAGDIQTMEGMMPALGLDLLLRGPSSKAVQAGLHFFSIFEIWYIVVLAVGFAALAGCSRKKAAVLTLPVWAVPMLLVMVAAMFRS